MEYIIVYYIVIDLYNIEKFKTFYTFIVMYMYMSVVRNMKLRGLLLSL